MATSGSDRRQDAQYLQDAIHHISDADLLASLDFPGENLADWAEYWPSRRDRGLFMAEGEFQTHGELLMPRQQAAELLQSHRELILPAAEKILAHNITGWGDVTIQHGPRVDFNAEYGRSGKYGFHYWYWGKPLIQAFLLTQDQKYLTEFDALFNAWYEQRDSVKGDIESLDVIWYELGLGIRNRFFLQYYYLPYERRSQRTHERMLKTLLGAARWLYEEEKRMYRGGNWQIIGSFGLVHIALMLPEFKEAEQWVSVGVERLLRHTKDDHYADGCHSERCPSSYSMVTYRDARNLMTLLETRSEYAALAESAREPLGKMERFLNEIAGPDGYLPGINDGSRSKLPESMRRSSGSASATPRRSAAEPPDRPASVHFPHSGFTLLRSPSMQMLINHGPSGGGHSHADSLSFELHAFGEPLAIDAGIGRTYDDPNHLPWYVTSKAHNMLTVEDADLDRRQAEARDVEFSSLKHVDFFAGTHYAYTQSHGVVHRRHVAFIRDHYFIIHDQVSGATARRLTWNLHRTSDRLQLFPARMSKIRTSEGIASVRGIQRFASDWAKIEWLMTDHELPAGGVAQIGMLLLPAERDLPQTRFETIYEGAAGAHYRVTRADQAEQVIFAHPGMRIESEGIRFSGSCAVISDRWWSASGALELKIGAKTMIDARLRTNAEGEL